MSDIRTRIVDALHHELDEHDYEDDDEKRGQVAHHFADVLLSLPGIAVVEVPGLTKYQLRQQYWITFDPAGIYWLNEPTISTPEQAREFAAALLAAANAAEVTA